MSYSFYPAPKSKPTLIREAPLRSGLLEAGAYLSGFEQVLHRSSSPPLNYISSTNKYPLQRDSEQGEDDLF